MRTRADPDPQGADLFPGFPYLLFMCRPALPRDGAGGFCQQQGAGRSPQAGQTHRSRDAHHFLLR